MTYEPTHHIDRHILRVLIYNKTARYRDLRPAGVDSNLFNYHRKVLLRQGYIAQAPSGAYELAPKGYRLAERVSFSDIRPRERPKLSVLLILTSADGKVAVGHKPVQPYIGTVNLPNGKVRFEDNNVLSAAQRVMSEIAPGAACTPQLAGFAEVSVTSGGELVTHALYAVAKGTMRAVEVAAEGIFWVSEQELKELPLTPGAGSIYADFSNAPHVSYRAYVVES